MKTHKFARKPFYVDAVRVSDANIGEVAAWCQGVVCCDDDNPEAQYISVKVHRPLTERQTQAFVGDWVLFAGTGFKVYTPKAFDKSFEKVKYLSKEQADIAGIRPPHEPRVPKNPVGPKGPKPTDMPRKAPEVLKPEIVPDEELSPVAQVMSDPEITPISKVMSETVPESVSPVPADKIMTPQDAAAEALIAEVLNTPKEASK